MADSQETIGPYSLEKLLGSGGMGQVYQAYDHRLQRRVAIKQFQNGSRTDAASRKRFLHEARAAASLSHPSIVQIHDILEDESGDWIVMERVEGPSVAELVAQGPLPVARAVRVALQVTEGLVEAHDHGILHRDLKSENVMLARGERAKILDFGLAKRLWPGDQTMTLSGEGRVLGTCRAMSPEQARSLELDARSDLFALGVLLYEMLTGQSPFHADNHTDTLTRVCHFRPPPVSDLRPDVPPELVGLVGRLLEKGRERRPESAQEVAEVLAVLDSTLSPSGSVSGSVPPPSSSGTGERASWAPGWLTESVYLGPPGRGASNRWFLWVLAGLALVLAVGLWSWQWTKPEPSLPPSVAVLGFRIDPELEIEGLAKSLTVALGSELAVGESGLRTVDDDEVARARREMELPVGETLGPDLRSRLAQVLAVDWLLVGSLEPDPENGGYRLRIRLQDATDGTVTELLNVPVPDAATENEIFDLVRGAGRDLREQLGARRMSQRDRREAEARLPRDKTARRLYSRGLEAWDRYDYSEARDLLEQAVVAEPGFPFSHAALAEVYRALGQAAKAQQAAERAEASLSDSHLSIADRLLIKALYGEVSGNWGVAIEHYTDLWKSIDRVPRYGLLLARALVSAKRGADALEVIAEVRALSPQGARDLQIDLMEVEALKALSQYEELRAAAERLGTRSEELGARILQAEALLLESHALLRLGKPEEARSPAELAKDLFLEAGDPFGEAEALNQIATVEFEEGHFDKARAIFQEFRSRMEAMENLLGISRALTNIASCWTLQGHLGKAEALVQEALALADQVGDLGQMALVRVHQGEIRHRRGDLEGAQESFEEAIDLVKGPKFSYAQDAAWLFLGQAHLTAGKMEPAREALETARESLRESSDERYLAWTLASLGALERVSGDLAAARAHHEEASRLLKSLGGKYLEAVGWVEQGWTELAQVYLQSAAAHAERAQDSFRLQKSLDGERRAVALEISVHLATEAPEAPNDLLLRAEGLLEDCEGLVTCQELKLQIARAWHHGGQAPRARQALEDVIQAAASHGLVPLELEAHLALADLEETEGRALEAQERRRNVHDRARDLGLGLLQQKAGSELPPSRPALRDAA